MNLFRNTYNDLDEIREWIRNESGAMEIFRTRFPDKEIEEADLEEFKDLFDENENIASAYREYHYGRQWNV